jgi:3-methyladenine DNA glycosylase AlkC
VLFYMPHGVLLEGFAQTQDDAFFAACLEANFELTARSTAEFSIRPFLEARLGETLEALRSRLRDPNPHVRRLVSEGTRPRLPWATHLRAVRDDPRLTLPLLEDLRDDSDRYVTRSVANHLGDIGKDHPGVLLETAARWLDDLERVPVPDATSRERRWLVRHGLRHPSKKGDPKARALRRRARD